MQRGKGCEGAKVVSAWLDRGRKKGEVAGMNRARRGIRSFTMVEILVVVSIIGLLAGLSIPAVGGALRSAKKAKVAAMAQQIRVALSQYYTEYGTFMTNGTPWDTQRGFGTLGGNATMTLMGSTNNPVATTDNPRSVPFLEVPMDFMMNKSTNTLAQNGMVTPTGFYRLGTLKNRQVNFYYAVDHDYNGTVWVTNTVGNNATLQEMPGTTAVWFVDPDDAQCRKTIGTWK